jgi:hypothetical protein
MRAVSKEQRQQVTERANGLCEYCQTAEIIVVMLEVDHIKPESAGGATHLDNLCFICRGCNSFKHDFQTAVDPDTSQSVALFNPRQDRWEDHFKWSDDGTLVIGLSPTGRATIDRLRMNRDGIVASRRLWVEAGWHPPRPNRFPLKK